MQRHVPPCAEVLAGPTRWIFFFTFLEAERRRPSVRGAPNFLDHPRGARGLGEDGNVGQRRDGTGREAKQT